MFKLPIQIRVVCPTTAGQATTTVALREGKERERGSKRGGGGKRREERRRESQEREKRDDRSGTRKGRARGE